MYVGVDIGGTKTLVAALDGNGVIVERTKLPTSAKYEEFLDNLSKAAETLTTKEFRAGCVAVPGEIDREHGIGTDMGNLPLWRNVHIQADSESVFHCPILIENDANLGGLSESMLLPKDKNVLYVTVSTGIGTGFIGGQQIVPELEDSEGGQMLLEHHGKLTKWEDFASGRAIVEHFGKKASEITDETTWRRIAHDLSLGFLELMAIGQPDIIVIGGSVGAYFDRCKAYVLEELAKHKNPLVPIPVFQQAQRPEEAVLYGCYDFARTHYGRTA